jgi:hypothetical protein
VRLVAPVSAPPDGDSVNARKKLWIGQRFLLNERGHFTVSGNCGIDRIVVEIEASIADQEDNSERGLARLRSRIQAAAREKWVKGEACPVFYAHSGRLMHHAIALTFGEVRAELADCTPRA